MGKEEGLFSWEVMYMRFPHSLQGDGESFVRVTSMSRHMSQEHLQETDMRGDVMTHQCLQRALILSYGRKCLTLHFVHEIAIPIFQLLDLFRPMRSSSGVTEKCFVCVGTTMIAISFAPRPPPQPSLPSLTESNRKLGGGSANTYVITPLPHSPPP